MADEGVTQKWGMDTLVTGAFAALKNRPDAKLGGDCYMAGNIGLFASGAIGSEFHAVAGALTLAATSGIFQSFGKDDRWFALGCATAVAGMAMTSYPAIAELASTFHTSQPATIFGTTLLTVGYGFGALKPPLMRQFQNAKNLVVRNTLGKPRVVMGVLSAASKAFLMHDAVATGNTPFIAILSVWFAGDYFMARSGRPALPAPPLRHEAVRHMANRLE